MVAGRGDGGAGPGGFGLRRDRLGGAADAGLEAAPARRHPARQVGGLSDPGAGVQDEPAGGATEPDFAGRGEVRADGDDILQEAIEKLETGRLLSAARVMQDHEEKGSQGQAQKVEEVQEVGIPELPLAVAVQHA